MDKREKRRQRETSRQKMLDCAPNDYAAIYTELHRNEKAFAGRSIRPYVKVIGELVAAHRPVRLLDYGSGKGYQYLQLRVHDAWGGLLPHCFDVGVRQLSTKPTGTFGGIICTDVMEHIDEPDIAGILRDIFSFAEPRGFVFFAISTRPAYRKMLPDGRNMHLTVRPPIWWSQKLSAALPPLVTLALRFDESDD